MAAGEDKPRHSHSAPHTFQDRASVDDVSALIASRVRKLESQRIELKDAAGRVLASQILAEVSVPPFDRAAMDGYAVRGQETTGASATNPVPLRYVGATRPGRVCDIIVGPGQALEITTGSALPQGADSVVRVESTRADGDTIWVHIPSPPGRNVGRVGEDIRAGTVMFEPGRRLRPQDLGVLRALGITHLDVIRRPRVTIIVTGDELVSAGNQGRPFQIADSNSIMLEALITRDGGLPQVVGPVPDVRPQIRDRILDAQSSSDLLLISGGSSAGPEDYAPGLIAELGELIVHGVALRPAAPSGVGFVNEVPVVLLPGNPVSCLCAYDYFGGAIVRLQGGLPQQWPYRSLQLPLSHPLTSPLGRTDYARVRITNGQVESLAISGASNLSSTTRADGFVVVDASVEEYPAGAVVTVWLYDP